MFDITWCMTNDCPKRKQCWRYCANDGVFREKHRMEYYSVADFRCFKRDDGFHYFMDKKKVVKGEW